MKCFSCEGEMKDSFANYMTDIDGHFIIIKNVPCHKCSQCGEVSYSGKIVAKIEEIVENKEYINRSCYHRFRCISRP